ncbi:unnamed protein product [Rhodiola kirilowii]
MQLINWNVRGANGRKKQQEIRNLRSKFQLELIFIQETKIRKLEKTIVQALWGGEKMDWFGSESEGSSGGLVTIWDPDFMHPISKVRGKNFVLISGMIKINHQEVMMNFLNVYAPRLEKEKLQLWETLVTLKSSYSGEWIIGGLRYGNILTISYLLDSNQISDRDQDQPT